MDDLKREISALEYDKQQLEDYIQLLKRDNERLRKDKKILKVFLKENKLFLDKFSRQGYRYDKDDWGWHYLVFPVKGIPGSLDIKDVKQLIEEVLTPYLAKGGEYAGYSIESLNYSERGNNWYVQIGNLIDSKLKEDEIDKEL
jgi:hypothetical protein